MNWMGRVRSGIFRVHYDRGPTPHINHVRLGDRLFNFERYQFAGLICMQNAEKASYTVFSGATIYRHFPTDIDEMAARALQ